MRHELDPRGPLRQSRLPRGSYAPERQGFTLVELLIVMSLIALMLGIGLGMFSRFDLSDRVALSQVQNVIRSARNWAVAREAPARVVLDAKARALHAEGMQVVGTWHFEGEPIVGAFGFDGGHFGGHLVDDGYQGRALSFAGERARAHVDLYVQKDPTFDLSLGFALRCAVRPAGRNGGVLLDVGGAIGLETTDDGGVKAWLRPEDVDEKGQSRRGGRVPLATRAELLTPGRWSTIELQYDRRHLVILVDDEPAAEVAETAPVSKLDGPLVISPAQTPFPGAIDSLVVSATVSAETSELPKDVGFAKGAPAEIVFTAGGGLDRTKHKEPVRFAILYGDGRTEPVFVNLYGTVE